MTESIEIRPATKDDLEALVSVGDQLFDHEIKEDRAMEFFRDPRHHLILAFDKNRIIGMVSGFHYIHPDKDPSLFINETSVLEEYRNRGIGRKLVNQLCLLGKQSGCNEAWLAVEKSNAPARKAYKASGGQEAETPALIVEFQLD